VWFLAGSLEREPGGAGEGLGRAEEGLTARFELVGDRVARRTRLGGLGGELSSADRSSRSDIFWSTLGFWPRNVGVKWSTDSPAPVHVPAFFSADRHSARGNAARRGRSGCLRICPPLWGADCDPNRFECTGTTSGAGGNQFGQGAQEPIGEDRSVPEKSPIGATPQIGAAESPIGATPELGAP
jgi:hypothetical protein